MSLHSYLELMPSVATRAVTVRVSRQFTGTIECVFDAWLDLVTAGSFLFATAAGEVAAGQSAADGVDALHRSVREIHGRRLAQ